MPKPSIEDRATQICELWADEGSAGHGDEVCQSVLWFAALSLAAVEQKKIADAGAYATIASTLNELQVRCP